MQSKRATNKSPSFLNELELYQKGYLHIAGVDEAGRGPLAGPVVSAAVILPQEIEPHVWSGVRDSKQLTESARERFYEIITKNAVSYAVSQASPREIEILNIRQASLLAMKRAIERLNVKPDYVLVDGRDYPDVSIPGEAIIRGDQLSLSVGAASIIAKVVRDRIMTSMHLRFPQYGFDRHKGYPTAYHRAALELFGTCEQHRSTYAGVGDHILVSERLPAFHSILHRLGKCKRPNEIQILMNELSNQPLSKLERFYLEQRIRGHESFLIRRNRTVHPLPVDKGNKYETWAIDYLARKGYVLWERNYRGQKGEIDLIVNRGSQIVFVEVKSRKTARFGMPYEAVTKKKQKAIIHTADQYLYERDLLEGWDVRYDVISILEKPVKTPVVEHFEDAFRVDDVFEKSFF